MHFGYLGASASYSGEKQARDALAIVALFREYSAALDGKHPFTEAQFKTLADSPSGAADGRDFR